MLTVNIEAFPDSNEATVDLPTPLPPTMDTNESWVLYSSTVCRSLNLSREASTKNPSSLLESFEVLKLISQTAPNRLLSAGTHILKLIVSVTSESGVRMELMSAWQALEEQGSTLGSSRKQSNASVLVLSAEDTSIFISALSQ